MASLMDAVKARDAARVRELIRQGAPVSAPDAEGQSPLILAAYQGDTEIVRLLLEAGADVAAVDPEMEATALHAAAYAGSTAAAKLLVEHGVDIDRQGPRNGFTALHDAIWQDNVETARLLIEAGARLDLASHAGETPLAWARSRKRHEIAALIEQRLAAPRGPSGRTATRRKP
jgi:ankyrin repeat protein